MQQKHYAQKHLEKIHFFPSLQGCLHPSCSFKISLSLHKNEQGEELPACQAALICDPDLSHFTPVLGLKPLLVWASADGV